MDLVTDSNATHIFILKLEERKSKTIEQYIKQQETYIFMIANFYQLFSETGFY